MGDDGFFRALDTIGLVVLPIGDTIFSRGKVTKKYIENGEYLVDFDVWVESIRGHVSFFAKAKASLVSKENPLGSMGIQ